MPTVEDFEVQVYKVERIRIRLKYPDGKDVRGDKQGLRAELWFVSCVWDWAIGRKELLVLTADF